MTEAALGKLRLDAQVIQQGQLQAKQKKLSAQDMQEMIRYGADRVFRTKQGTITDDDIEAILSRGAQLTAEVSAQYCLSVVRCCNVDE